MLTEHNDTGGLWSAVGDMSRFFVPFDHTALAEAALDSTGNPDNGTYTYLAHDHLGTGRYGFDEAKTQVSAHEHLPFGQRYSVTGPAPYHEFTGKPWDPDVKLYYFPFRYYSPNMNRWTMADPAGLIDGPNVYAYVKGGPILYYDNCGLSAVAPSRVSLPISIAGLASCIYGANNIINPDKLDAIIRCLKPDRCNHIDDNCATACVCLSGVCNAYIEYMACYKVCTGGAKGNFFSCHPSDNNNSGIPWTDLFLMLFAMNSLLFCVPLKRKTK